MKRLGTIVLNLAIIAALIGGVALYNYNNARVQRHAIHVELMVRRMDSPHAKDFKPVTWDALQSGQHQGKALADFDGQQVVFLGYGFPTNADYIRDLGSIGSLGMDPCCPKPISYRNVTSLELSPLPYHVYFWKHAPATINIAMQKDKPASFVADQPAFYRGTLKVEGTPEKPVLTLVDAEKLDTSKGSVFG